MRLLRARQGTPPAPWARRRRDGSRGLSPAESQPGCVPRTAVPDRGRRADCGRSWCSPIRMFAPELFEHAAGAGLISRKCVLSTGISRLLKFLGPRSPGGTLAITHKLSFVRADPSLRPPVPPFALRYRSASSRRPMCVQVELVETLTDRGGVSTSSTRTDACLP